MARAVRGDDHAFATVIRHYDELLRAFAFQLLRDTRLMDEVLREAYVKAYRLLPAYRADTRPSAWLFRIVYNACVDALAAIETIPAEPNGPAAAAGEPASPTARPADGTQLALWLDDALIQLPFDRRAAVLLVDLAGFDGPTTAEVLGITVDELGAWLAAARPELRAVVDAGGGAQP
ncbi:MAG: RNA polymerase sigma factor [Acidimicrobiales bacterium]